jgi:hypothetical protein
MLTFGNILKKTIYKSKFEAKVGACLKRQGIDFTYEKESFEYTTKLRKNRLSCSACGSNDINITRSYTPDFFLSNNVIIEAKGKWTADGRRIAQDFPEIKLLFMRDNRLSKASKTTYSEFCDKKGLDYYISYKGEVPSKWIKSKNLEE